MTRTEASLQIRDHVLSILRQLGSYQSAGDAKFLMWNGNGFAMIHRTPFQKWDTAPGCKPSDLPEWKISACATAMVIDLSHNRLTWS